MQEISENKGSDKAEIIEVLRAAAESGEGVILSPQEKPISLFANIESVTEENLIISNSIPPLMVPYVLGAKSFQVLLGSWWVRCRTLAAHGRYLKIAYDDFGRVELARTKVRRGFSEQDDAKVRIRHPFDSGTWLVRSLYDFSEGGMSFRSRMSTPLMQPNRVFDCMEVFWGGELRSTQKGRIVYVRQIIDIKGQYFFQVGVQFSN
jgi:hypothetical protein